jgi:hypothetical protein
VIRRAFWLSVGAAAGIAGYRRASAVGRAVQVRVTGMTSDARTGTAPTGTAPAGTAPLGPAPSTAGPFWPPRAIEPASAPTTAAHIERPVARPPAARRPGQPGSWSATKAAWRTSRAAWRAQKTAVSGVRSAGRFARDVREGMDVYMSRQDD